MVQKLLNADFGLEESIEAVEKFEELEAAMDYLENKEDPDENGLDQESVQEAPAEKHTGIPGMIEENGRYSYCVILAIYVHKHAKINLNSIARD